MSRLDRVVLLAYPRSFRREHGDEMARTIEDLRRHGGVHGWRLARRLTVDLVTTAPRLHLEAAMGSNRVLSVAIVVGLVLVVAVAAVSLSAMAVLAVAVVLVAAGLGLAARRDRPIARDPGPATRWAPWLAGGIAGLAASIAIAPVGGEELSEPGWAAWLVTTLTALTLLAIALVHGMTALRRRRTA